MDWLFNSLRSRAVITLMAFASWGLTACTVAVEETDTVRVAATTGMVADLVKNVGGDHVEVTALMGPGVDPHLYKASADDVSVLSNADVIFYNGLHLEAKLGEILEKMQERGLPVHAVAEEIDPARLMQPDDYEGQYDPHIWFDLSLWVVTVDPVVEALSEVDPDNAADYAANGEAYREQLRAMHEYATGQFATIPAQQRVLITAHDAFGYMGRAYDIEVMGLQGISTASEYGLRDVERVVNTLVERGIKAVFVESSISPRSIDAVISGAAAEGHTVVKGGELFSDAMGAEGTPEGTFLGMVRHNVDTIVSSLK